MVRSVKQSNHRAAPRKTPKPPTVMAKSKLGPVALESVEFVRTPGTRARGYGPDGEAWIILAEGKRAGTAYINIVEDTVRGKHASFHVFLNRPSQGRQIGRAAYRLCCLQSQHNVIYAHMRKSNIASRKAAEHAGFVEASSAHDAQLVMVWHRPTSVTELSQVLTQN
ncbi:MULTISPECIES: GNAT family N-acetyltransferase [unclassified Pseudomonas]|uniref:GNAT family N-acetyltransferase n=1 Tax=unclassified Pseudomonas TaxID=196821 RepID=UPI0032E46DA0